MLDTKVRVRLVESPRKFPDHLLVMIIDGFVAEMQEVQPDGHTRFSALLYKTARAALGGWWVTWERLQPGVWGLRRADVELLGTDLDLEACRRAVRQCFADARVDDVEVEVAAGSPGS